MGVGAGPESGGAKQGRSLTAMRNGVCLEEEQQETRVPGAHPLLFLSALLTTSPPLCTLTCITLGSWGEVKMKNQEKISRPGGSVKKHGR